MNRLKLILRSLFFYRRTNLPVVAGVLISSAILTGALIIGDSVRYSLQKMTELRTGLAHYAVTANDRIFTNQLAVSLDSSNKLQTAAVFLSYGIGAAEKNDLRLNSVQIVGFGEGFWKIGRAKSDLPELNEDEIYVNRQFASATGIEEGDEILVKIGKPQAVPGDISLTPKESGNVSFRANVRKILGSSDFGNFGLRNSQVVPTSIFIPLKRLSSLLEIKDQINLILVAPEDGSSIDSQYIDNLLDKKIELEDIALKIKTGKNHRDIISRRIFIPQNIEKKLTHKSSGGNPILTYFVNSIDSSHKEIPYSFISAFKKFPPDIPAPSAEEIVLNSWAARELNVKTGDQIKLTYFVPDQGDKLQEKTRKFKLKAILPIKGSAADSSLMPQLPGIVNEESCRDWDPGIPIDLALIQPEDEEYWKKYKGTPKGFISFDTAKSLWGNRFGQVTTIRYEGTRDLKKLKNIVKSEISPMEVGFQIISIKKDGIRAGAEAVDFGELFLGLSFFIIAASLILTALLASLAGEQRRQERGVLISLGFTERAVTKIMVMETSILVFAGALTGVLTGILYNRVILYFLGTIWKGATGTSDLYMKVQLQSLLIGFSVSFLIALLSILITQKKQGKNPQQILSGTTPLPKSRRKLLYYYLTLISWALALYLMLPFKLQLGKEVSLTFQAAGFLILIGVITLFKGFLIGVSSKKSEYPHFKTISYRNIAMRSGRSVTITALLGIGVFVITSVGANRHSQTSYTGNSSGTGGFTLIGELTLPVKYDLNNSDLHGLNLKKEKTSFLQFRSLKGDDASCLNLNRIKKPSIIATDPKKLMEGNRFSFAGFSRNIPEKKRNWNLLKDVNPDGTIPAIADMTVIVWGLGKKPGDILEYTNERGEKIRLKLAAGLKNSIFQGKVVISRENFIKHFPSVSGSDFILIDTPPEKVSGLRRKLSRNLEDYGAQFTQTWKRLEQYNTIENTYLSIFLALGGLGLIIGTIGIGTVITRNIYERREELALLIATGFTEKMVKKILIRENLIPFIFGISCGLLAAFAAILPSLITAGKEIPWIFLSITTTFIILNGLYWTYRAVNRNCTSNLIPSLRNE